MSELMGVASQRGTSPPRGHSEHRRRWKPPTATAASRSGGHRREVAAPALGMRLVLRVRRAPPGVHAGACTWCEKWGASP